ncbi:LicD family protein [Latilactobacillus sakei]|uniref:LicD family protein n=1 Tax=Latilactobacillus sakei TaxID=1599 RepID=UPI0015F5A6B6|nr:LicD family protein [Latilactobacillus sakei]QMU87143.1 LicD family protein [Latilactobacillus sakei]
MTQDVFREGVINGALKLWDILRENEIDGFLIGGSAIGAAREQGMIPWDDDVDYAVKRKDIKKLEIIIEEMYSDDTYYLVVPEQEPDYYLSTYKFVNKTGNLGEYVDKGTRLHGAFIDIFPLDKTPNFVLLRRAQQLLIRIDRVSIDMQLGKMNTGKKLGWFREIAKIKAKIFSGKSIQRSMIRKCKLFNWLPTGYCYYNFSTPYGVDREIYFREEIAELTKLPFEGRKLPVARGYDAILRRTYGDYMQLPSEENRTAAHIVKEKG